MIETGKVLQDRYRIKKQIGQGGMGAVYVGTDERFGSTVAIKETLFSDASFSKAFEREARLLNNLRHAALPRVSDHFSDENGQFLVMEYIAGDDLAEMIEKRGTAFPLKDVLNWSDQLLDALDFLHTQETPVIHRDIKPQNLKLTPRGQIILLDFGLAKGNPTDAQHQTAAKSVFGYSRNYASIEQMQGTGTDPRSDLYSLGATIYHLLTGVPPTDALTRAMQVLNGDPDPLPPAHTVHNQIPETISEVLQRAMALNSNRRPSSAIAMRTMLSENSVSIEEANAVSPTLPLSTGLLTQNTEVFDGREASKDTRQAAVRTEVMPGSVPEYTSDRNDAPRVDFDDETSVKTRMITEKRKSIQVPVVPESGGVTSYGVRATQKERPKHRLAVGAALSGLLLVGGVLGGFYLLDAPRNGNGASNVTIANKKESNEIIGSSGAANSNTSQPSANDSTNADLTEKVGSNTGSGGTTADISTPKTVTTTKELKKLSPQVSGPTPENSEAKVLFSDEEGNRLLNDGTIRSKDGMIIYPDGKIVKNGKVIVIPNPNVKVNPFPPDGRVPPLNREQLDKLTPAQRRKIRQLIDEQRRQTESRPLPTPPDQ